MPSYAVVGASRGIGLEYVRQLARKPDTTVFAIVRSARASTHLAAAVNGLVNVHVVEADVTDYHSLEVAAQAVSKITGGTLDILIHNAARMDPATIYRGVDQFDSMEELDADFIDAFKVNTLGVVHSVSAFLPLLRASSVSLRKIVVVSTGGADPKTVRRTPIPEMAAYGTTKAAALMVTTKWALKLQNEGFVVVSIRPGLVDTTETYTRESGDPEAKAMFAAAVDALKTVNASIVVETPSESVASQLKTIDGLKASDNGLFLSHKGGAEYTV